MKFHLLIAPAGLLLLGACTTYPAQTAANTEVEAVVADESTPAEASAVSAEEQAALDEQSAEWNKVVCKRKVVTGSRFAKKVCMTRADWRDNERRGRDLIDDIQRGSGQVNNPQGG
jgi:uncharacterized protein (DUF2147 family)